MLRAYGFRIAAFAIVGLLLGLLVSLLTKPKYEAVMQILVDQRPIQNAKALTEAEATVEDLIESGRPRSVQTQVEQLTGFGVLGAAAQTVALERGLNPQSTPELNPVNLQKAVRLEAARESDIITLRVRMSNPDLARDMASRMYEAFDQQNQDKSKEVAARAVTFLETQSAAIEKQLKDLDNQLSKIRQQYNAPDIKSLIQSEIASVKNLEEAQEQARIDLAGAQARATALRAQLQGVPKTVEASTGVSINQNYQQLQADLSRERAKLASLRTQYLDDAVPVREQRSLVANLDKDLRSAQQLINAGRSYSPNPVRQSLEQELAQAVGLAASAQQRLATATTGAVARRAGLEKLPEIERKVTELERKQEGLQRLSLGYQARLESLRVAQRGRVTTSSIVSPAFAYPDPVSPNFPLNLGSGLIAGLLLGLLSAFSSESKKSPIRNLTHLNRLTLEPAFRTIPELPFVPMGLDRQPDDVFVTLLGNFMRSPKRPYRMGVIGVAENAGATVTSSSLALAAALEGQDVLLVDTAKANGVTKRLGLSEAESVQNANAHLTVLRTGGEEIVQANQIIETLRDLEVSRSLTVVDLQPFKAGGNPVLYLAGLDECILLVRAGQTRTVDFLQAQQMLIDAGVPQVTVVLSRARSVDDDFSFMPASDAQPQALATR